MSPLDGLRGLVEAAEAEAEQLRAAEVAAQEALITCEQAIRDQESPKPRIGYGEEQAPPFEEQWPPLRDAVDLARLRREGAEQRLEQAQKRLAEVEGSDIAERYIATRLATDRARVFEDLRPIVEALAKVRSYELAPHPSGQVEIIAIVDERPDPTAEDHAAAVEAFGRDELERGRCLRAIRERLEQHRVACEDLPRLAEELALTAPEIAPVEQREIDALVALYSAPEVNRQDPSEVVNWLDRWGHTFAVGSWGYGRVKVRDVINTYKGDPITFARLAVELGDVRDAGQKLYPREPSPDTAPDLADAITRKHEPGGIGALLSN